MANNSPVGDYKAAGSMMSRCQNLIRQLIACSVLLAVSPVLVIAAGWIVLKAGFPILYRSRRIGLHQKPFVMLKLRTMRAPRDSAPWPSTTAQSDARLIPGGAWLRRWKIDELPQLINIVRGEMAFVGPRPEMPVHLSTYKPEHYRIFDVLPGLTDLASIRFFDLSSELAQIAGPTTDPDVAYLSTVHAERMRLRLEYVQRKSFWLGAYIVMQTIYKFVERAVDPLGRRFSRGKLRNVGSELPSRS